MPNPGQAKQYLSKLESLNQNHFTTGELADLLGVSPSVIIQAVRRSELNGYTVDHHIVDITREDALAWLRERART